jgi:hypothetical protein
MLHVGKFKMEIITIQKKKLIGILYNSLILMKKLKNWLHFGIGIK